MLVVGCAVDIAQGIRKGKERNGKERNGQERTGTERTGQKEKREQTERDICAPLRRYAPAQVFIVGLVKPVIQIIVLLPPT